MRYRGEKSPIAGSGTRYGIVERLPNGTVVESYTTEDGELSVRMVNAPTLLEQALYEWRVRVPSGPLIVGFSKEVTNSEVVW